MLAGRDANQSLTLDLPTDAVTQPAGTGVFQARSIGIEDFDDGCPVPPDKLGMIYRADAETLPQLVAGIPEGTRARLAAFLYGRSHTRELGIKIAATCAVETMKKISGALGEAIYLQARRGYEQPTYGEERRTSNKRVSLASSCYLPPDA